MLNGQLVRIVHSHLIIIGTITNTDRYNAARKFGVSDVVAQAMVKGLCYTKVKGV